jgi:putative pyruvate formate lyase activating enzyme
LIAAGRKPTTAAAALRALQSPCRLCPRNCAVRRDEGERGVCRLTDELRVYCCNLHHGEEPPISGTRGSGTVFFSGCNLRCVFCQNYAFSQGLQGEVITPAELAARMLALQTRGAHNINWVTPTPQLPQAVVALAIARAQGLTIPLVFNCSGYESLEVLRLLDGVVDIYLPDAKYADSEPARLYSGAPDYPDVNRAALKEMLRQVGHLQLDAQHIATRGLLIRHLILPDNLAGTPAVLRFIAEELGRDTAVSLMRQYFPAHRAREYPAIARQITWEEYEAALECFDALGLNTAYIQEWPDEG